MSDYIELGRVKDSSGYYYTVSWNEYNHNVYCDNQFIGSAYSAREAMHKAEAWAVQQ